MSDNEKAADNLPARDPDAEYAPSDADAEDAGQAAGDKAESDLDDAGVDAGQAG